MTHEQALLRLDEDIRLRGLATHTRKVYVTSTRRFLEFTKQPVENLAAEHIREYLLHLVGSNRAPGTVNQYAAAIRFFYAVTLDRTINYLQVPRMKKPKKLPVILTREEVERLLDCCTCSKHKAFILLAYGSGLRLGEIARLTTGDIRSKDDMRLFIRDAKGAKDRYTILPKATYSALRQYWRDFRPEDRNGYLFPGTELQSHINPRTIAIALSEALKAASITKRVTMHTLRHGFATHLLEDGYSIMQIKELLGHASIKSTTIYLHLANTTKGIVSPADALFAASSGASPDA